jgi:hypothetical protein
MEAMASRWFPEGPVSVRPRTGWVFLGCTLLVTLPVLVSAFTPVRSTTPAIVTTTVVLTVVSYIYFVAPRVVVGEDGIRVQNSWREHVIPWGALVDVETRFNLTLVTADGAFHAQGAPSPGGMSALRARSDDDRATKRVSVQRGGAVRPGDLPASVSGALAVVIRGHWQDLVEAGVLDTSARPTTAPRRAHLALTVGGAVLTLVVWLVA